MNKKKRYIAPYVDFSLIEEEETLLAGSTKGSAEDEEIEDGAKASSGFDFDEPMFQDPFGNN